MTFHQSPLQNQETFLSTVVAFELSQVAKSCFWWSVLRWLNSHILFWRRITIKAKIYECLMLFFPFFIVPVYKHLFMLLTGCERTFVVFYSEFKVIIIFLGTNIKYATAWVCKIGHVFFYVSPFIVSPHIYCDPREYCLRYVSPHLQIYVVIVYYRISKWLQLEQGHY